jgi:hypothetical protein
MTPNKNQKEQTADPPPYVEIALMRQMSAYLVFLLIRCFHFVSFVIDLHSAVYSAHNRVMSFVIDLHSAVYSAHNLVMSFVIDLHSAVYSAHNRVMSFVIDLHSVYSAHNRVKSLF